ncbi:MAG TPA: DNA polymerase III subunit beta [Oscillatoriaceae cyanobacterium]
MRLVCSKENFARGIQAVQRAVSSRGPLPILTHIKLVADAGALKLTATDLDVGLEARVPADVHESGSIALTAKTFAEIVSKLPNSDIEMSLSEQEVTLKCLRSKFTLRGMPAAEFPELPQPNTDAPIALPAEELLKGIRQTAFAAAGEDKAVISGIFIQLSDGQLELVATDGYRLSWRRTQLPNTAATLSVIVPKRAMDELARQLGAVSGDVTIAVSNNQAAFQLGDRYMTSRLVDGTYPNYRQIIPTTFVNEAVLDRASLLAAVDRVSIMAFDREAHIVKLEFSAEELRITAGNTELGDSVEVLSLEYTGEPLTISFNADYLVDALKNMDVDTIRMSLNTPLSPVLLRPLDNDSHTCLVMPLNRV